MQLVWGMCMAFHFPLYILVLLNVLISQRNFHRLLLPGLTWSILWISCNFCPSLLHLLVFSLFGLQCFDKQCPPPYLFFFLVRCKRDEYLKSFKIEQICTIFCKYDWPPLEPPGTRFSCWELVFHFRTAAAPGRG